MNIAIAYPAPTEQIHAITKIRSGLTVRQYDPTDLTEALCDSEILCGHVKGPVDWDRVLSAGKLRWIQSSAAGTDHCLPPQIRHSDIPVSSASGVFAKQVAEQTLALLLGLIRSLPTFFRQSQDRKFVRQPTDDLHGKTIGIVGFGGNGQRIARVLSAFECALIATDLFPTIATVGDVDVLPATRLDELLEQSDVVIATVPLTEQTNRMFNAEKFERMKPGAWFINVARGQVVDEPALLLALHGHLAGAGLDVTYEEPLSAESPLWLQDNVIITPHVGAQSARRLSETTKLFCDNLTRFLNGQTLINLVDKSLGFPRPEHRQIVL